MNVYVWPRWWNQLSISKKIYAVVGGMVMLVFVQLLVLLWTLEMFSGVRGLVTGGSQWAKAQKNAVIDIQKYLLLQDEIYYQSFLKNLNVPLGDLQARQELENGLRRQDVIEAGLLQGKNDPRDIPSIMRIIMIFHEVSYIREPLRLWAQADQEIHSLMLLGASLHRQIQKNSMTSEMRDDFVDRISIINGKLMNLEEEFSNSLRMASHWMESILMTALFVLTFFMGGMGVCLAFFFHRSLSHSLEELSAGAQRIGQGDYGFQVAVHSEDEIGRLAQSLNHMSAQIKEKTGEKNQAEEANQVKSLFLANMSHEIRTPLSSILGFVEILKDDNLSAQERNQHLNTISRAGESLATIINDILDISKVEAGKIEIGKEFFSLKNLLQDLFLLLHLRAQSKGIDLTFVAREDYPEMIYTDPLRLRQILLNVIGNAIKFTHKGAVRVTYWIDKKNLFFSVQDTGGGISPEQQGNLFQVFSQGDLSIRKFYGGTGLGLTLSRKLSHLLEGDVFLANTKVGQGSEFVVRIHVETLSQVEIQKIPTAEMSGKASVQGDHLNLNDKNILLVEDTPDNQMLLSHFLNRSGAVVEVAENGLEAVRLLETRKFDVILMDMQMPVLDGYSATERIRQNGIRTPIIALTAHAMKEDLNKCLVSGCDDILTKPVRRRDLLEMVARHCAYVQRPLDL